MAAEIGSNASPTTLITTSGDMARVLISASACSAAAYALAAHEEACETGNDRRVQFWHDVCRELAVLRGRLEHAA